MDERCPTTSASNNNSQTESSAVQGATTDSSSPGNEAANINASNAELNSSKSEGKQNYDNIVKNFSYTIGGRNVQIPEKSAIAQGLSLLPMFILPPIGTFVAIALNQKYNERKDKEIEAAKKLDVMNEDTRDEIKGGMTDTFAAAQNYAEGLKQEIGVSNQRIDNLNSRIQNEGSSPRLENELRHAEAQKAYLEAKLEKLENITLPIMARGIEKMDKASTNTYMPSPELLKVFHDFNPNMFANMSTTAPFISYLMGEAISDNNKTMGSELNEILQGVGMQNMEETASKAEMICTLYEMIGKDFTSEYERPDVAQFIQDYQQEINTFPISGDVPAEAVDKFQDMITHQNEIFNTADERVEHNNSHQSNKEIPKEIKDTTAIDEHTKEVDEEQFREAARAGEHNI